MKDINEAGEPILNQKEFNLLCFIGFFIWGILSAFMVISTTGIFNIFGYISTGCYFACFMYFVKNNREAWKMKTISIIIMLLLFSIPKVNAMVQWYSFGGVVKNLWEQPVFNGIGVGTRFNGTLVYDASKIRRFDDYPENVYDSPVKSYRINIGGHFITTNNGGHTLRVERNEDINRMTVYGISARVDGVAPDKETMLQFTGNNANSTDPLDYQQNSKIEFYNIYGNKHTIQDFEADIDRFAVRPVPEPGTLVLLGTGLLGLFLKK